MGHIQTEMATTVIHGDMQQSTINVKRKRHIGVCKTLGIGLDLGAHDFDLGVDLGLECGCLH